MLPALSVGLLATPALDLDTLEHPLPPKPPLKYQITVRRESLFVGAVPLCQGGLLIHCSVIGQGQVTSGVVKDRTFSIGSSQSREKF
jgi:hypothetical protein